MTKHLIACFALVVIGASSAFAQTGTDMVEVEPITCWWRTSTSAVQTGQSFGLTLTCAVVETEANKVVPDFSKLDPTVVQLPPFEVQGGTHAGDLVTPGKRFFQYDYRLRLIAEDAFGVDVTIPPLEISYRIESKVTGGDTTQGRDQSYSLPRASVRLISLVPDDTSDIREAPAAQFTAVENRDSRANLLQTIAGILFGLAGVVVIVMLISMLRRKTVSTTASRKLLAPRTILSAVAKELDEVQRASRGGWTPELGSRALAAARIAGAYASGRTIGQVPAGRGTPVDGVLVVKSLGRPDMWVSGASTAQSANAASGMPDALKALTAARFGRGEKFDSTVDEAIETAKRVTRQQQSAHSLMREWSAAFIANVVDLRRKIWA
ncbi:MAG TPA: hypothetical protein VF491_04760 [Vicinamibacterales bacterium]|jgi:hypothetical protein